MIQFASLIHKRCFSMSLGCAHNLPDSHWFDLVDNRLSCCSVSFVIVQKRQCVRSNLHNDTFIWKE